MKSKKTLTQDSLYYEGSFEEQMADLGVPIERKGTPETATVIIPWMKAYKAEAIRGISIGKWHIAFGENIVDRLREKAQGNELKVKVMIVKYRGAPALVFDYDPRGFKLLYSAENSVAMNLTMGQRSVLKKALSETGIKPGRYNVDQINSGAFMATKMGGN